MRLWRRLAESPWGASFFWDMGDGLLGGVMQWDSVATGARWRLCFGMDRLALFQTIGLLTASNVFMNLAWYSHLGRLKSSALWVAVLASWGLAFFEYSLMVPANRIGAAGGLSVPQLKVLQEALTLTVFVPVCLFVLKQPIRLDFLWAALCLVGAVYFIFRSR